MSDEVTKESLTTELDTLKAVYLSDLVIEDENTDSKLVHFAESSAQINEAGDQPKKKVIKFSVNLLPSTANDKAEQFVALKVCFQVSEKYPDEVPLITLMSPRGLSDEKFNKIQKQLNDMSEKKKGHNMLYELIDFAKEQLTMFNFPSGKCMICLYEFTKDDVFTKTDCFHHFHCHCLADYTKSQEAMKQVSESDQTGNANKKETLPCPVCREESRLLDLLKEPYEYPLPALSKKPIAQESAIVEEARQSQEKFADIFEKQQQQGGIIDETKENEVLHISNPSVEVSPQDSSSSLTIGSKDSPKKSKSTNEGCSESLNTQATVSEGANKPTATKPDDAITKTNENATTSSSPVEVTSTTKGKENVKPENKPRRKNRRNNYRRNRTKSREVPNDVATNTENRPQSSDEQDKPQQQRNRRNDRNDRGNGNFNYNYRNNRPRNQDIEQRNQSPRYNNYRGYNQDNRYRSNGYNNYNNYDMNRDRPGYYAARVFRRFNSRPKPDDRNPDVPHENSTELNNQNSSVRRNSRNRTEGAENGRNSGVYVEGTRRNRYSSDEGYNNGNAQSHQSKNRNYNNYYRQPQSYNPRGYYDYNQMNRYSNNYYDNYSRYYGYPSSRDMYYNGGYRGGYRRRRQDGNDGSRRRNNTLQSQSSSKVENSKRNNSPPVPNESSAVEAREVMP